MANQRPAPYPGSPYLGLILSMGTRLPVSSPRVSRGQEIDRKQRSEGIPTGQAITKERLQSMREVNVNFSAEGNRLQATETVGCAGRVS